MLASAAGGEEADAGRRNNDLDQDESGLMFMDSPGLLRKVPFPFGGFLEVVAHMEDGPKPSAYAAELTAFLNVHSMSLHHQPCNPGEHKILESACRRCLSHA